MKVRVRVPATTANMGPGFDCLGMALSLHNEFEFEVEARSAGGRDEGPDEIAGNAADEATSEADVRVTAACSGVRVLSDGKPYTLIPLSKNLVYQSFARTLRLLGAEICGVTLTVLRTDIPIARGLGSSAACIVAGVLAAGRIAEELIGYRLSCSDAMDLAVEMEGHPDNVVPAMVGGMTAAVMEECRTVYSGIPVPHGLTFAAIVPSFRLSTEEARGVLPERYSRSDIVFNVGRAALLAASFAAGDVGVLRVAVEDRIHQPYRLGLIPNSAEVISSARAVGSQAEFLSGSGPTIMAVIEGDGDRFALDVSQRLANISGGWVVHLLKPEMSGAQVETV